MGNFFEALKAGKELANAATWKNAQMLASALAAVIGFSLLAGKLFGLNIPITDEQIISFSGGIAAIACTLNAVVTAATSKKVGLPGDTK
jgi:hypothetical protein